MTTAAFIQLTPPITNRDHVRGPGSATVTLVGYGDYACPLCNEARVVVKQLHSVLGDRMRYAFRNFPVSPLNGYLHRAAEAAEASAAQNKFWEMHDFLYDHRWALSDRHLKAYATQVGLDMARFNRDMMLQTYSIRVYEDILSAVHSGISSVPAFFINDNLHLGPYDFETLLSEMQELAKNALIRTTDRSRTSLPW